MINSISFQYTPGIGQDIFGGREYSANGKSGSCIPYDAQEPNRDKDSIEISPEARALAGKNDSREARDSVKKPAKSGESKKPNGEELTADEKKEVEKLQKRDREVRAHEQAHLSAAGSLATGGANFDFKSGPDGKQYAVGGEVPLKIPDAPTPEEDLRIANQVQRAALAPAKPSSTDYSIAGKARQKALKAEQEISEKQVGKIKNGGEKETDTEAVGTDKPSAEANSIIPQVTEIENQPETAKRNMDNPFAMGGTSFDRGEISGAAMGIDVTA